MDEQDNSDQKKDNLTRSDETTEDATTDVTDEDTLDAATTDDTAEVIEEEEKTETVPSVSTESGEARIVAKGTFPAGTQLQVTRESSDLRWDYQLTFTDEDGNGITLDSPAFVTMTWEGGAAPDSLDPDYIYEIRAYKDGRETGARTTTDAKVTEISFETDGDSTASVEWTKKERKAAEEEEEQTPAAYEAETTLGQGSSKLTIKAEAEPGVLPEDAQLHVEAVRSSDRDYSRLEDKLNDTWDDSGETDLLGFLAYDIFFTEDDDDDTVVEPQKNEDGDSTVTITMEWETTAKPTGLDSEAADIKDLEVSALHVLNDPDDADSIKNAEVDDLTDHEKKDDAEDDEKTNVAYLTTRGEEKAVEKAEITVDHFSYFVLAWHGQKEEETDHVLTAENADYKVTVTYDDNAELPEGAKLSVKELSENSDDYKNAKAAVIENRKAADASFDEKTLGLKALDISILDGTEEVEPQSAVQVKIELKKLPSGVENGDSLQIQHITSGNTTATSGTSNSDDENNTSGAKGGLLNSLKNLFSFGAKKAPASAKKKTTARTTMKATTVAQNVRAARGEVKAEFSVDGFSVFTVTWTKGGEGSDKGTNIGSVKVRFVDANGLEITAADFDSDDLSAMTQTNGGVVDLSAWADKNGSSRVSGYTYDHAVIGSRKGTTITGVKVAQATETRQVQTGYEGNYPNGHYTYTDVEVTVYRLYYTTDATVNTTNNTANHWILYTDSGSETYANNANIFLFYKEAMKAPITFHFIDRQGNAVTDSNGNTSRTVDADTWGDTWKQGTGFGPTIFGYEKDSAGGSNADGHFIIIPKDGTGTMTYTSDSTHVRYQKTFGSLSGDSYRWIRYTTINGTKYFQVGDGGSSSDLDAENSPNISNRWSCTATKDFDAYIVYVPSNTVSVTIHHVDESGSKIAEDTTSSTISTNGTFTANSSQKTDISGYTYKDAHVDSFNGNIFTTVTYTKGDNGWTSSVKNGETDVSVTGAVREVWLVYSAAKTTPVTIHHVDSDGNTLHVTTTVEKASGSTLTPGDSGLAQTITGYTATGRAYYLNNNSEQVSFVSISYNLDESGSQSFWSTKYKAESGDEEQNTSPSPVTDVFLTYTRESQTIVFHHVDSTGTKLREDTQLTISDSDKTSSSGYGNRWNGFSNISERALSTSPATDPFKMSGIGTWQKMIVGNRTTETEAVITPSNNSGLFFRYDTTEGTWQTGVGSTMTNPSITKNGLVNDIYNVYANKGVVIHHVDEDGKTLADDTYASIASGANFNYLQQASDDITGYSAQSARLGSYNGTEFTTITYTKTDDSWSSTVKNGNDTVTADSPVNEVWIVYSDQDAIKHLTLHYQYVNKSGSYGDAYYGDSTQNTTEIFSLKSGRNYLVTDPTDGNYVETIYQGKVKRPADSGETGPQSLVFMSSHLAGSDGPIVTSVDLTTDGNLIYHTSMEGTADPDQNSANPTSWTLSQPNGAQRGRSLVITKTNNGNLQLSDSLNGDFILNLVNDAAETGSSNTRIGATYKATLQNENYTVEYTVTADSFNRTASDGTVTQIPRYGIEVLDSYKSTSTDIYQVYVDGTTLADKLWIEDDMKYSGLFRTGMSDSLQTKLSTATDISYEWHRITVDDSHKSDIPEEITDDNNGNYEIVRRKQSGEHWNIALDADKATWLDVEADEGTDVWTKGTTHAYYVKLTYTPQGSATPVTIYSTPISVQYYGQLENGGFEDVAPARQYSNEGYKTAGGVWQTTGPGSTRSSNYNGQDIEIVDGTNTSSDGALINGYHWNGGSRTGDTGRTAEANDAGEIDDNGTTKISWAREGKQFAEINAENAGALYQDVITHPNENINFWVSHRARGASEADQKGYKYDTMYVVIMPTKLAMTMGDDETELRTQSELKTFISAHGGFDESIATENIEQLTYYDEDTGILIYKISSSETAWHDVNVINNYKAKGGLTRFFFCAASTAGDKGRNEVRNLSDPPTQGNFVDNIGFSQSLPPTSGFNLTVTETFSGLTMEQLAGLASNASSYSRSGITAQARPLQVTITNTRADSTTGTNDALSGAKLGFTMGYDASGNLALTPTAKAADGTTDLLGSSVAKPGASSVRQYSDGRIVISWVFPDQILAESTGQSTDQTYNYVATDNITENSQDISTTDVKGFTKTTSQNAVDNSDNSVESAQTTAGRAHTSIKTGADKTLNIINVYSPTVRISVRKTFSGVTPKTVAEMMNGTGKSVGKQYSVTITKGSGASAETKILKVDGGYTNNGTAKDATVSVTSSQGSDGTTTYKWLITDPAWQNATYSIREDNYTTTRNTLSKITVNTGTNGAAAQVTLGDNNSWPSTNSPTVTIVDSTAAAMTFTPTSSSTGNGVVDLSGSSWNGTLPDTAVSSNTNLIVGQYTLETTETTGEGASQTTTTIKTKKYIVWTAEDVGLITRRAIINQINSIWGETAEADKASTTNTTFFTGDNAYIVSDGRIARMVNRESASLTGQGATNNTWDKFYSARMVANSDGSSVDESEIRIENDYVPKIKIQKQSSETTTDAGGNESHTRINGAVFRIYKKSTTEPSVKLYLQDTPSTVEGDLWKGDTDNAKQFKTAKDTSVENLGDGIALLTSLPTDSSTIYYLEEYKAPDGYNKISDIAFKVRSNGTVTLVDSGGTDRMAEADEGVELTFIDPYYTFVIDDDPGFVLPETGGSGTKIFYMIGGLLALGTVLFAALRGGKA